TSVAPKKTENEADVKKPVDGDKKSNGLLTSLFNRGSKKATPATDALGNTPADMTSTKKKLTKIPEGFSEITLQTQGKTAGYKKDDADLDMKFGIQMKLSDDYLLLKLEEYQNSLVGFPQFDGGDTQAYNQYLEKVDAFLEASSDVKPLTFTYTLGKDFTIDNRTTTRPDTKEYPLIVGTEKIGECVVTKDAQGVCSVTVKFDKKIYNRYAVSASQSLDLQVDKTALKDAEPVYVGFEDEKTVVETQGQLDPSGPTDPTVPDYSVDKSAKALVETPYIDYTIDLKANKDKKNLNGMLLEDPIPKGFEVSKFAVTLTYKDGTVATIDPATYQMMNSTDQTLSTQTLNYTFPKKESNKEILSAVANLTIRLNKESYNDFVSKKALPFDGKISNQAKLHDKDVATKTYDSEDVKTTMKMTTMSKEGAVAGMNGTRFVWTLNANRDTGGVGNPSNIGAYVIDYIWKDQQSFETESGIQVYKNGKYSEEKNLTLLNDSNVVKQLGSYQDVTGAEATNKADLLRKQNIALNDAVYYEHEVTTGDKKGKTQIIMIIPVTEDANYKFKYHTNLNLGGLTIDQYLAKHANEKPVIQNEADLIWAWYFGEGPEPGETPTFNGDVTKEYTTNLDLANKTAVAYDPATQKASWRIVVNEFQADLTGANNDPAHQLASPTITDIFDENAQIFDESSLQYEKWNNKSGTKVASGSKTVLYNNGGKWEKDTKRLFSKYQRN
ncbi:MAG: hypothetical protein RR335_09955, partial [Eubacterium sp.]